MSLHNPFFPKHSMKFKVGGASLNPFGKNTIWNPLVPLQQTKNFIGGKGLITNSEAKKNAANEANALNAIQPSSTGSMAAGDQEALQAEQDARRNALRNMGFMKTIYAGETGGYKK